MPGETVVWAVCAKEEGKMRQTNLTPVLQGVKYRDFKVVIASSSGEVLKCQNSMKLKQFMH